MSPTRLLAAALLFTGLLRAGTPAPLLNPGESLTYRVGWGLLGHAGEFTVRAAAETVDGRPGVRISTTSATRGLVRALYSFDGDAWTLFDAATGRFLAGAATTRAARKKTHASITFDHEKGEAFYTDHLQSRRSRTLPIPAGPPPVDFITALVQSRAWALSPGETHEALVLFDDEFYPLRIKVEKEETVSGPDGRRKALLLVPTMPENPKGMFRRGGEVRVWISDDEARVPLRFEVKLKVGTAYATLVEHRD